MLRWLRQSAGHARLRPHPPPYTATVAVGSAGLAGVRFGGAVDGCPAACRRPFAAKAVSGDGERDHDRGLTTYWPQKSSWLRLYAIISAVLNASP